MILLLAEFGHVEDSTGKGTLIMQIENLGRIDQVFLAQDEPVTMIIIRFEIGPVFFLDLVGQSLD